MRIAVAGALAAKPANGGEAWVRLSYILGLRRLGAEVSFVEQVDSASPAAIAWFESITRAFAIRASLVDGSGTLLAGACAQDADALLNISGNLRSKQLLARFRRRAYVDLDPCFTQIWHAAGTISVADHHAHFTVGENIGTSHCSVPADGIEWRPTRPPVVLAEWPVTPSDGFDRFTTVATWRPGHGSVTVGGSPQGLRVHAFRRLMGLPRLTSLPFEAALAIDPTETSDLALLRDAGWTLVSPDRVAGDPAAFRSYVAHSGAEFTVAQEAYTATRTGWLSDRTTRYLASGRPALVEDTGQRSVPTGHGLVTFSTVAEARRGAKEIAEDYEAHSIAARKLATRYFDSDAVLGRMLEDLL
jgi:hypothetical protein